MATVAVADRACPTRFDQPVSPYRPGQPGNDFKPLVAPLHDEPVVPKRTNSAFVGTDLGERLADWRVTTLVVCGVLTHNSLEATVRNAGNLAFSVFVPADCCWAVDKRDLRGKLWPAEDVHQLSLAHMHGEYATVTTARDILQVLHERRGD
jgi:nicotinamidase-related amidase